MAAQKGPLWWAGHHRVHHRYADTETRHPLADARLLVEPGRLDPVRQVRRDPVRRDQGLRQVSRAPLPQQVRLDRAVVARSRVLLDRRMERARRRVLRIHDPAVAHDVLRELARARLRPACLRDRRHEPELDVDRAHHRRRGLAQQPPPLPVVGAAGLSLVADRHDVLRVEGARRRSGSSTICGSRRGARARRSAPRPAVALAPSRHGTGGTFDGS